MSLLNNIYESDICYKIEINKKYSADFINMLERHIRFNPMFGGAKEIEKVFNKFTLQPLFKSVKLNAYGYRWEIKRKLLSRGYFNTFYAFSKLLYKGKKILFKY